MNNNSRYVRIFEFSSIGLTVVLLIVNVTNPRMTFLFVTSTAQGFILEYLFHKLGKYRYPMERFTFKLPSEGYPPLSIVMGYFWFYSLPFYMSAKIIDLSGMVSPIWVILIMLFSSLAVELLIDNLLTWIGLWRYDGRRRRIGLIPVGVASTVPAFMTISLFLAYYSQSILPWVGIIPGLSLAAVIAVLGGIAVCGLRMLRRLPEWVRLILPGTITYLSLNLFYFALSI